MLIVLDQKKSIHIFALFITTVEPWQKHHWIFLLAIGGGRSWKSKIQGRRRNVGVQKKHNFVEPQQNIHKVTLWHWTRTIRQRSTEGNHRIPFLVAQQESNHVGALNTTSPLSKYSTQLDRWYSHGTNMQSIPANKIPRKEMMNAWKRWERLRGIIRLKNICTIATCTSI